MASDEATKVGFVVELDRFHGPLDLLLHLIREQDIEIFDIPISKITSQFLEAIRGIEELGIDNAGEFLELAATLVRIKAQMLLPRPVDESGVEEDPRFELVRRLLEYEHFREVARHLDEAEADRVRHFSRGFVPPPPAPDPAAQELDFGWDELWEAVERLAERIRPAPEHRIHRRAVPVEEKIGLILDTLAELARVEFGRLVEPFGDRLHTVVTLLAGLELAKRRHLAMRQRQPFAPLWLYRRNGEAGDPLAPGGEGPPLELGPGAGSSGRADEEGEDGLPAGDDDFPHGDAAASADGGDGPHEAQARPWQGAAPPRRPDWLPASSDDDDLQGFDDLALLDDDVAGELDEPYALEERDGPKDLAGESHQAADPEAVDRASLNDTSHPTADADEADR